VIDARQSSTDEKDNSAFLYHVKNKTFNH
jgi:hypothetical protein